MIYIGFQTTAITQCLPRDALPVLLMLLEVNRDQSLHSSVQELRERQNRFLYMVNVSQQ